MEKKSKFLKFKNKEKIDNENSNKKPKKKKAKTAYKTLIIFLVIAIFIVSALLAGVIYIITSAPEFDTDLLYNKEATVLTYKDANNNDVEFARLGTENRDLVSYDDLPQVLIDAIVATEDARFFQHDGFDIARFLKASFGQLKGNSGAGGASTLTMQVVKNTYTSKTSSGIKGLIRKFTDIYMSIFKIEKKYTKEEIIEFYVNAPWLGNSKYGVEQASQYYFGKSVRDLALPEAALIAGIFNAPATQNPFYSLENAENRRNTVLELMYKHGYITEEQARDAMSIPVESTIIEQTGNELNKYQSFIDSVVEDVIADTGLNPYTTPMKIETTLKPEVQDVLNDLNNEKLGYKFINNVIQVAIVVTDSKTGAIVAVDGRRNQKAERELNLATSSTSKFQPGSTAKPIFAYGPLIEYNGASTGTYFFDEPYTYSNGASFKNADGTFQGIETMRTALSQSRNIPAVQAFQKVDKEKISQFVHALGIDYGNELYEPYAIGGGVYVNPAQMAAAYGAFARGGYYIEPFTYNKIIFKSTGEELDYKAKQDKVMSEETAYMITSMLMTAQQNHAGGNFSISGTDVAAKTGTSTYDTAVLKQYKVPLSTSADNWNITYSPDYVISLWYGYEKLSHDYYTEPLSAARNRKLIMSAIAKKIYPKNSKFSTPSGLVRVEVEKETVPLELPSAYTPQDMRITELFKSGTEPTEESIRYQQLDSPTNGRSTSTDTSINLSWDPIPTPAAISENALHDYFNENYERFADKYFNKRISYNNEHIGTLGYQVYLNNDGNLVPLGYTNNNSYTYNTGGNGGTYKFVIKSAYSIFKDNMSNGLEISVTTGSSNNTNTSTASDIKLIGEKDVTIEINDGAYYNDPGVKAVDINGSDITNKVKKTIRNVNTNEVVNSISQSTAGKYEITYKIDDKEVKRTVTVG